MMTINLTDQQFYTIAAALQIAIKFWHDPRLGTIKTIANEEEDRHKKMLEEIERQYYAMD